ncbi:MAG: ABC transporter substrate-binding protein, partial [Acidobacteria bacterium]|nr:ABC transporter substrate-binding protein [Acidobacteriota bacterium]
YTVRPPEARRKPKISSFLHARYDKIAALEPDLILAFSDLQAEITTELVKRGYPVFTFNQRSVDEILQMVRVVAGIAGVAGRGVALADEFARGLEAIRASALRFPHRPRVYFEEWDEPLISGIRWVEELVEIAGGTPIFPELRTAALGRDRIVTADRVIAAAPEVFIGSWCGKPVRKDKVRERAGWDAVPFVVHDRIHEVKSTYILQPGPAALTEGVRQLHAVLCRAVGIDLPEAVRPAERWDDGAAAPRPTTTAAPPAPPRP